MKNALVAILSAAIIAGIITAVSPGSTKPFATPSITIITPTTPAEPTRWCFNEGNGNACKNIIGVEYDA